MNLKRPPPQSSQTNTNYRKRFAYPLEQEEVYYDNSDYYQQHPYELESTNPFHESAMLHHQPYEYFPDDNVEFLSDYVDHDVHHPENNSVPISNAQTADSQASGQSHFLEWSSRW